MTDSDCAQLSSGGMICALAERERARRIKHVRAACATEQVVVVVSEASQLDAVHEFPMKS